MELLLADVLSRAIGVSNFYPDRLVDLIEHNEVTRMVNQIESHPFFQRHADHELMRAHGVRMEAWGGTSLLQSRRLPQPKVPSGPTQKNSAPARRPELSAPAGVGCDANTVDDLQRRTEEELAAARAPNQCRPSDPSRLAKTRPTLIGGIFNPNVHVRKPQQALCRTTWRIRSGGSQASHAQAKSNGRNGSIRSQRVRWLSLRR
jgi:hypothetical protein